MSDSRLAALARANGVATTWHDFRGQPHDVTPDTLRAVLRALGVPAGNDADVQNALREADIAAAELPPLLTALQGLPLDLPGPWTVTFEDGGQQAGQDRLVPERPGYHRLERNGHAVTLAVAPPRAHAVPPDRPWGIAAQLYSLRRAGDGGIGDFGGLRAFAAAAAAHGADAVAISPVHAQFSADPDRFSPYAPSSRIMLNVLHAEADGDAALEAAELVDWPRAARLRLAQFRARFDGGFDTEALAAFRGIQGDALERHARFEALHAHFFGRDPSLWNWNAWPEPYRKPDSPAVEAFAAEHAREVAFHAFLQWQADHGLAAAQSAARDAGMRIGLVADLAVGTDGGGSHAWSRPAEMMRGLAIGAPPDLLNTRGQNWGISAFSPLGLRRHGFAGFIELLRAALRHAGGVRIDHAMGLQRLWVVPDGADAADGAYLHFPLDDMLRLLALESHRHQAVIVCEDLGTVPDGFSARLAEAAMLGMRVLWFERDDHRYRPPREWTREAVAMTSTHDLATVAGWWQGRDIAWRHRIGLVPDEARERQERDRDRHVLWGAMRDSGAADGDVPPSFDTWRATDAALAHVGRSACALALLPLEDVLAREEQPNLPGTISEHPNWSRRMPGEAERLLEAPDVAARLDHFRSARAATP